MAFKPIACTSTTTAQFRAAYDASNYTDFTTSSGGDLTIAPSGGDTTVTGTLASSVRSAVGGAANDTGIAHYIRAAALSGTSQYGSYSNPTVTSAATSLGAAYWAQLATAASAFTCTSGYGIRIQDASKGAGSTITTLYGLYIADQTQGGTNYALYTNAGIVRLGGAVQAASTIYIGDDANTSMTLGLTINQAGNDNEILALKSSDVAHGITTIAETDTFLRFVKSDATNGGCQVHGLTAGTIGVDIQGMYVTDDTTKSTAGSGGLVWRSRKKSGTNVGAPGANANLLVVQADTTTRFILDADGDSHQDVGTAWTNFDVLDDVATLNLLSAHVTRTDDPLRAGFTSWLEQDRSVLEKHRLVTFNDDGHHFVNMSRLTMLHTGALRQIGGRQEALADALATILDANPNLAGAEKARALLEA